MRPPGPPSYMAISAAMQLLRDPRRLMADNTRRYGPVWQMPMLDQGRMRPLVWLMGPEGNERILAPKHREDFSWYQAYRFTMEPIFGKDILLLLDDEPGGCPHHRVRHKQMSPAFHPQLDADYVPVMREIIERRFHRWEDDAVLDLGQEVKGFAFHVVARLLFGAPDEDVAMLTELFEEVGLGLFSVFRVPLPGFRYRRGLVARKRLERYLQARIDAYRDGDDEAPGSMLTTLLRQSELSDDVLVSEVIAFVFAGYDTTASLLTSFFACLGLRPEIYEGVRDEARALPDFTYASMQGQRLMDAAWLETARLHPPLTFNMRGVVRDIEFEGFHIGAGSKVAYSPWFTGRMEELFEEPGAFRPERFMSGRDKLPKWSILAFGGGQRPCIGKRFANLEMRLFANMLLKRWDLEFIEGQSEAMFFNPAMQRAHGYKVRLHGRSPSKSVSAPDSRAILAE